MCVVVRCTVVRSVPSQQQRLHRHGRGDEEGLGPVGTRIYSTAPRTVTCAETASGGGSGCARCARA
eukprot:m.419555 g.419555  ORF g.419555 m.419555 type:complete len:66 (+) comp21305_c0_seq1:939-1136(+)